jgi:methionine aminopeptidase
VELADQLRSLLADAATAAAAAERALYDPDQIDPTAAAAAAAAAERFRRGVRRRDIRRVVETRAARAMPVPSATPLRDLTPK